MQRTGIANLPLHGGKAPAWLFQRMVRLSREIATVLVEDYGPMAHAKWPQGRPTLTGKHCVGIIRHSFSRQPP